MNLSCEQCRELLALHVDIDLPADVASHLQTCANCTREYNIEYSMLRAGVLELRALPPMPAPANLRERVRAQIAQEIADANETSQKKSRIAPRFALPRFALPRFTMPRPMIPRWATYALPPFAVTACLLLLLSREPNTTKFSDVRDAPETSAPAANTLDNENKTSSQKPPGKRAPQTAKTRAQNESSTRSANQSLRNSNNSKNARDAQTQNAQTQNAEAQNAEAQNAATDADSPPAVEPQAAQAPQVKSNIPTEVAPRNSGKDSRSAAQSRVAPVLPSAKPPTSAPRLFARLETDQSARSVSREYSKSSTTDGASTNVAPPSTQVAPVIAPPTSSKNADGDLSSDTSSRDTSLDASGNDASGNDENRARIKSSNTREPENSADSALLDKALENELRAGSSAPASSSAPAQSAPQPSSDESTFSHRSSARSAKSNEPKTGVSKPSVAPMPAPVLPDEFASNGASNGASSDASSSMMSNRAASSNTAAQKTLPAKSPTSSTRSDRKTRLLLTLPKTSASLRVQIRWRNGATQTVWNGRGVRGQKLKIEVSPPRRLGQNATRNKNARAQVSVQEAAPIPNSSRASWKTIAREEIAIQ